jgi:hypothetical protein
MKHHSRSARGADALRVMLLVAHGASMRYGYAAHMFKTKWTGIAHKVFSTLVASASLSAF